MALSLIALSALIFLSTLEKENVQQTTRNDWNVKRSGDDVKCAESAYPPPDSLKIPEFVVDLDLPPAKRWHNLSAAYAENFQELLLIVKNVLGHTLGDKLFKLIDDYGPKFADTLPYPYADEMRGIANATNVSLGEVVLYNVFYEVFTVCTSILTTAPEGRLLHGRNMDFGLLLGWDSEKHSWKGTEVLRRMTVQLDVRRNGKTLFRSVSFVGYIGVLTAMKPGQFSLSVDERFQLVGGYVGMVKWFLGIRKGHWMSFLTRDVMENATGFEEARKMLSESELLAPVYFILGGSHPGQACVITRGLESVDIWNLGSEGSTWYLVETNYDHWKDPPFYDDRRNPAKKCLDSTGMQNMTFAGLFNVLYTKPVLNKLTTYVALMEVANDTMETYLQYCADPCPLFSPFPALEYLGKFDSSLGNDV